MLAYRINALLVFGVLLTVAGCKRTVSYNVYDHDDQGPEVHTTGLKKNTEVTWRAKFGFTINFVGGKSPCLDTDTLTSAEAAAPYTVTCTIKNDPTKPSTPFEYKIAYKATAGDPSPPPNPPSASSPATLGIPSPTGTNPTFPPPAPGPPTDHCEGCVIEN